MQSFQLGDTRVTRIEELIGPLFDPMTFFPTFHQGLVTPTKTGYSQTIWIQKRVELLPRCILG